ncbi:MAG: hypothetical protein ABW133_18260 [Polyangiaceae bacterium]
MSELSSEARALLREARGFDDPSAGDAERVHASVLAKVGIAVGAGVGVTAATTSLAAAPVTALSAVALKFTAAIVIAGGVATGGYVALRPTPVKHPPAIATSERLSVAPTPAPVVDPLAPAITPAPLAEERRADVAPRAHGKPSRARHAVPPVVNEPAPTRATSDLEGEAHLIEQADADLRRGDANAALGRLSEHAAKYPSGALREEREGMRVVALCRAGRVAEGNAAAERFLARSPRSALASRIRAACGGE